MSVCASWLVQTVIAPMYLPCRRATDLPTQVRVALAVAAGADTHALGVLQRNRIVRGRELTHVAVSPGVCVCVRFSGVRACVSVCVCVCRVSCCNHARIQAKSQNGRGFFFGGREWVTMRGWGVVRKKRE